VISSVHLIADLTLDLGEVVHDYLSLGRSPLPEDDE
jgi:acetoacetate decarboxylase